MTLLFALLASGSQASDWCYFPPPADKRAEPTVEYHVLYLGPLNFAMACMAEWLPMAVLPGGCSVEELDGSWNIYIQDWPPEDQRKCILTHEKAHLPPNNWQHGPFRGSYLDADGLWQPSRGPRIRRSVHKDWSSPNEQYPPPPLPDWLN